MAIVEEGEMVADTEAVFFFFFGFGFGFLVVVNAVAVGFFAIVLDLVVDFILLLLFL